MLDLWGAARFANRQPIRTRVTGYFDMSGTNDRELRPSRPAAIDPFQPFNFLGNGRCLWVTGCRYGRSRTVEALGNRLS
jgi:hypothetical protein